MASNAVAVAVLMVGMIAAAIIDLRTRRVPNELTAALAVVGLTCAATGVSSTTAAGALLALMVGLALMLPGYISAAPAPATSS